MKKKIEIKTFCDKEEHLWTSLYHCKCGYYQWNKKNRSMEKKINIPVTPDYDVFPDTGWRCAVCFQVAQVKMIDVILCVTHAKRYNFGYGDALADMREEFDGTKRKV